MAHVRLKPTTLVLLAPCSDQMSQSQLTWPCFPSGGSWWLSQPALSVCWAALLQLCHTQPCVPQPEHHSWEGTADNESPLAQPVIVIYEIIVLIYIKWLLLRLLLEFDFEKKKLFSLHNADFVMLIVFLVQVTWYLKHPTAFLLQIKWCLLFPLAQAWPLLLPSNPHFSDVSIFVGLTGPWGNLCGGFKGDHLVGPHIPPSSSSPWPLPAPAGSFLQCPSSVWLIFLPANLPWLLILWLGNLYFPEGTGLMPGQLQFSCLLLSAWAGKTE